MIKQELQDLIHLSWYVITNLLPDALCIYGAIASVWVICTVLM